MTLTISLRENPRDPQPAPDVADIQTGLIRRGISCGPSGADGIFGGDTDHAVRTFQRRVGIDVDGRVGPITWDKLRRTPAPTSAAGFADTALRLVTSENRPAYRFGAEVSDLTDRHPSRLDCSELVQWAIFQETHVDWRDGSWYQAAGCTLVPVSAAIRTKGALLFVSRDGSPAGVHHVAISLGNGKTAEARSTARGCGSWPATGRFNLAGLCPVLKYAA